MTRTVSYAPSMKSRTKRYAKKALKGSATLREVVKQAITKMAEKKCVIAQAQNVALSSTTGVPGSISLQPSIHQGTSQNQRVGNQVRVTSCIVRGHINILPYNALLNPYGPIQLVKIWIARYKLGNPANLSGTDVATAFFDTGAGVTGPQANMFDIDGFLNKDSWELVTEKICKVGAASGTNTTPSTNTTTFDNSSGSVPFYFEVGKKLGLCLYNDSVTNPTNKNLFFIIQPIGANGAGGIFTPCEMHYQYKCEYIDV